MARTYSRKPTSPADELGRLIGESISAGILTGMRSSFANVRDELFPLQDEILAALRRDLEAVIADNAASAAIEVQFMLRVCEEPGCGRKAVARGLCRRHYARLTYRERRERQGATVVSRSGEREELEGAEVESEKKPAAPVAAVAPIVRRKKDESEEEAPAAQQGQGGALVSDVARFFGVEK